MYKEKFDSLYAAHEIQSGDNFTQSVEMLLCDLFYNVRDYENLPNSGYDISIDVDSDELLSIAQGMQKHGAHGYIFWSAGQFSSGWRCLWTLAEAVEKLM